MIQDANSSHTPIAMVATLERETDELIAPATVRPSSSCECPDALSGVLKENDHYLGADAVTPVLASAVLHARDFFVLYRGESAGVQM